MSSGGPQPQFRCVEFVAAVTDWMEGALTDDDRNALEQHLVICPHCTDYLEQLRRALEVVSDPTSPHFRERPSETARESLLETFRREHEN